jgi:hypothetical protein
VAEVERRAQAAGRDPVQAILQMSHGEYDSWIEDSSQRGPRYCDNLQSTLVTYMVMNGLVIDAEYLEGDRYWPQGTNEDIDFDYESEELEAILDIINESDRTAVFEGPPIADEVSGNEMAVVRVDEIEVDVAAGREVQGSAMGDVGADAGHVEMLHQSRPTSPATTHDDQHLGSRHDVGAAAAASETLSLPSVVARDMENVDGML